MKIDRRTKVTKHGIDYYGIPDDVISGHRRKHWRQLRLPTYESQDPPQSRFQD